MFLDKGKVLSELNQLYKEENFSSAVLYSYPGFGKSRLLQEFSKDKRTLYFKAANVIFDENFILMKDYFVRQLGESYKDARSFKELFRLLAKEASSEPFLLILDDFPHLAAGNRRFSTMLSSLIRKEWKNTQLFLLLCKPASLYEKEAAKDEHPLLLRPFLFFEMQKLYPALSLEEQILLYSITGGIPGYLEYFSPEASVSDQISELFFTQKGGLYQLVLSRLKGYYSSSGVIRTILASIGSTPRRLQEVCDRTHLTPSAAGSLLNSLSTQNLTGRIVPVTEGQGSRRALYVISDNIYRFWYSYVYPYQSEIELGNGQEIFQEIVLPSLDGYLKQTFETISRDFLKLLREKEKAPFHLKDIGMWWGQHPTKKRTEYVSIAGSDKNNILLGTCFWTDEWLDIDALYPLQKHGSLFPDREKWYYLFSKSDFVTGFETISGNHVHVYSLEKMCRTARELLAL